MDPIRLRGPADVLTALPYQLGYHPHDCLVAMALHERRVGLVARIDLPASDHPEELQAVAASASAPLHRERPDSVLLIGYESARGQSDPLVDEVSSCLAAAGLTVADRLVVRQGRWYSRDCGEQDCCPEDGTPLPDPSQTPAVADFVALGLAPLPERAALTRLVAPDERVCRRVATALRHRASPRGAAFGLSPGGPPDGAPTGSATNGEPDSAINGAPDSATNGAPDSATNGAPDSATNGAPDSAINSDRRVAVQRLQWLSLWRAVCDVGADAAPVDALDPSEVAELVASLDDIAVRDGLIAWLCPGTVPLESLPDDLVDQLRTCLPQRPWHAAAGGEGLGAADPAGADPVVAGRRLLARLQGLTRAVPDSHAAPVLTVTANVAWWLGDGTVARVALDRALGYRLARLLDHMVGLGVRPDRAGSRSARP
jgi:hypothetical protein